MFVTKKAAHYRYLNLWLILALLFIGFSSWTNDLNIAKAAGFTPGNLVALRVGDSSAALTNAATAVFLDEITTSGSAVQSIALPTAVSGSNARLTMSGTATSEGALTRSADNRYLTLAGYDAAPGTATIASTTTTCVAGTNTNRVAARVDAGGNVDTSTRICDGYSGNNIRSAVTNDGTGFWTGGTGTTATGGVRYVPFGNNATTTTTQLATTPSPTNVRVPNIFDGQLYVSSSTGTFLGVSTVGTGLPTTNGQTITLLPGQTGANNAYAYAFLDLSAGVPGLDTLYIANQNTSGLLKFSLSGGTWTANGNIGVAVGLTGLVATAIGNNVTIYATNGTGAGNTIVSFVDGSGYNGTITGSFTTIATAPTNTVFRGIAFAPQAAPSITTQPANQTITSGQTATLSVVATGSPPLTYQWYQGTSGTAGTVLGTNASFTTPALTANTDYWVRVTNSVGTADSNTATITVSVPPNITTQPASQTIPSGQTATLSVVASGTAPLTYTWYQGTSGTVGTVLGTNSSFTTPALTTNTDYWVRVSNSAGDADSNTATITVNTPPSITTQPANQTITSGQTATLSVVATGTATLTYQWYQGTSGTITTPVGTNSSSFTTPILTTNTDYWVRVSNVAGDGDSNTATITVTAAPVAPSITTQPANQTIATGQTATLSVVATGTAPLTYQWYQGTSGTTTTPVGTNSSSFTTPALTTNTDYWVRVSNTAGDADSNTTTITVAIPPSITTQPANQTINSGQTATLSVVATGTATLTYAWYQGTSGTIGTVLGTNSSFTTPALTSNTNYWVRVTNSVGTADSNTATITVNVPPTITTQPASQTINSGQTATLSVVASGTAPLSYEWYQGNSGVVGTVLGTNASFTTPALTTNTNYWVRVINSVGSADSNNAIITINPPGNTLPTISVIPALSGVISDPTNWSVSFTVNDAETAPAALTVTATATTNATVAPLSNVTITAGSGGNRAVTVNPAGVGYADITITVTDGNGATATTTLKYAASAASVTPTTSRYHAGSSDASTAIAVDANYMIVADDENQVLRLYSRSNSGLAVSTFDFTSSLNLTDLSGGVPREVDIEASARVGNRIYWLGSHSNSSSGSNRPNRSRLFATDISGSGASATLSFVGYYTNLKADLITWDSTNAHGKGVNFYGLAASTTVGVIPEAADGSGFNIEGLEFAPGSTTTAYVTFRAPISPANNRTKALIVPVTNFSVLVSGSPTTGPATFGAPIELDLGGRGIREIRKNAADQYVIIAGPQDGATGTAPKDFRLYTWNGNPATAPVLRSANLTALNTGGSFESIVEVPNPLTPTSTLQLISDNGDTIFYNDGIIAKDLTTNNFKKSRSDIVTLGSATPTSLVISGFPSPTTAGIAGNFTVTIKDLAGDVVTNFTGTVSFSSSDSQATLPTNYTFIAGDAGTKSFSATLKTAGTHTISATSGALSGSQSGIVVNAGSATIMTAQPGTTPQSTLVNTAFGTALAVKVTDSFSNPLNNIAVSFTAPASGASGTFSGSSTVNTNASGIATAPTFAANSTAGSYSVTATSGALSATFSLTNNPDTLTPPTPKGTVKLLAATVRVASTDAPFNAAKLKATGDNPSNSGTSTIELTMGGTNNIPATATGVFGILTNIGCDAGGNLRFWTGNIVPTVSNLNIPGALSSLNLSTNFTAPLDANGKVKLGFGSAVGKSCGFVVDVSGYLVSPDASADKIALLPATVRVASTDAPFNAPKLIATGDNPSNSGTSTLELTMGGTNGIPSNAKGIIGVLTNVGCNAGGNLRFWTGDTIPTVSNLNIPGALSSLNLSSGFVAALDSNGKVKLGFGSAVGKSCGYVLDVTGYITSPDNGNDLTLLPATVRVKSTDAPFNNPKLVAVGSNPTNPSSSSTTEVTGGGANGIPATAKGLIGVVTNIGCNAGGNLRFWTGTIVPTVSNLNIPGALPSLNLSTGFITQLDSNGKVKLGFGSAISNNCGFVVDVIGYLN